MTGAEFAAETAARWNLGPCLEVFNSNVASVWIGNDTVVRVIRDTPAVAHIETLVRRLAAVGAPVQRLAGPPSVCADGWRATAWTRCRGRQGLHTYDDGCAWANAVIALHGVPNIEVQPGRGADAAEREVGLVVHTYMANAAPHLLRSGLSHQDAHSRNVFVHEGQATLIDLDTLAVAPLWWDALELVCEDAGRVAPEVLRGAHATFGLGQLPSAVVEAACSLRRTYAAAGR